MRKIEKKRLVSFFFYSNRFMKRKKFIFKKEKTILRKR